MENGNSIKSKKTLRNIVKVTISNLIKLLAGVAVGFLLPKIIGVTDYGYYKTFTLYSGYIGLFHFGIIDGILLKYGGKDYEQLNKESFRFYCRFLIVLELVMSIMGLAVALFFLNGNLRFILICLSVCLISTNMTSFYQYISQSTSRFSELSMRTIIQSTLNIIAILALLVIYRCSGNLLSYQLYTIIYTFIQSGLCIWYVITYRDLTFGKSESFSSGKKEITDFIKIGLPLLIANLCQSLILNIDRQFVNILFNTDTYAIYAFAYNMLSLITTATSAVAVVLYPTLKRTNEEVLKETYSPLISIILMIVSLCIIIYFPLVWFVNYFLPKYYNSLIIFRIILPGLIVSSAITIVMHNYYKVVGKSFNFFIRTLVILILSFASNLFAYIIFKNTISISIASIIVLFIWYVGTEAFLVRQYKIKWMKNFLYLISISISFYLITMISNEWIGLLLYLLTYSIFTIMFYIKYLKSIFHKLIQIYFTRRKKYE